MKLNYKKQGEGKPLIILHGLMGMLDNWQGPAKKLAENFETWTLDLRNHGHSPHSDEFNYESMANDIVEFIHSHRLSKVSIIGHSMGGKVAMALAQQNPELIDKLIVVDIAPRYYPAHHDAILKVLRAIPLDRISRRSEAEEYMKGHIPEPGVRQFLLKNLYYQEKGRFGWRFNLDIIEEKIEEVGMPTDKQEYAGPTCFIRGGKSNYITDADWADIKILFPNAYMETIEGARHWVHAEKPVEFVDTVLEFLGREE